VRIVIQFIGQIVALHVVRTYRPEISLPFRMWLYPLPSLIALVGWCYVLFTADQRILNLSLTVVATGCVAYVVWVQMTARRPGTV
jgi:hypothetical protein